MRGTLITMTYITSIPKTSLSAVLLLLCLTGLSNSSHALPRIKILGTGGTIAGAQSSGSNSFQSGLVSVSDLVRSVPQLKEIAEISAEQVCNIGSQTMTNEVWLTIAKLLNQDLTSPNVDGVVITHGTDTMEETAYFLSLVVRSDKPVVMVGAMRPTTALGADGPKNLYDAVTLAADPRSSGLGVLVILNGEIHFAREVKKSNTSRLNAFVSPNRGLAGVIENGKIVLFARSPFKYGPRSDFSTDGVLRLPRVEIVYSYASLGRDVIDYLSANGVKGIVLAGVGDGNTTDEALQGLKDAAKKGVVIVRSTRVQAGAVMRNIEIDDDRLGFITAGELSPQKARVLLMLALCRPGDLGTYQRYFEEY